jgi:glycine/D-amino acid oxidase-like deaminating enzyme
MFNSFCEIDAGTFENEVETKRFEFNKLSNDRWAPLLERVVAESRLPVNSGFGTYLVNNTSSDVLEDKNYDEIIRALKKYGEPFEDVSPREIPFYRPESKYRATRAVLLPREGWVNPAQFMMALEAILAASNQVMFVDDSCVRLDHSGGKIEAAATENSGAIAADKFLLCNGASFTATVEKSNLGLNFMRIFYGAGATLLVKTGDATLSNCVRTPNRGLACGLYAAPQTSEHTLIGASNFISPTPVEHVRLTSVYTMLKSAMEQLNSNYYRAELVRVNLGWRPTSSDTLPLLGKTSIANLLVATGTKRDGFHCSPVIAEFLADLMILGKSDRNFSLFDPERKPIRYLTRQEAIKSLVRHSINAAYQHDYVPAKNRMTEDLEAYYFAEFSKLHDAVGANDWGIPPELKDMYKYGHIK